MHRWGSLQNAQGMQLAIETQEWDLTWVKTLIDGFCQSFLACFEDKSLSEPWFVCRKPYVVSVASLQDCVRTQNRQLFFWLPHLYAPRDGKSTTPCIVACNSLQRWFDTLIPLQPIVWDTIATFPLRKPSCSSCKPVACHFLHTPKIRCLSTYCFPHTTQSFAVIRMELSVTAGCCYLRHKHSNWSNRMIDRNTKAALHQDHDGLKHSYLIGKRMM